MPGAGTAIIQFRAGDLLEELTARTTPDNSPNQTARRDLARYYALMEAAALALLEGQEARLSALLLEAVRADQAAMLDATPSTALVTRT